MQIWTNSMISSVKSTLAFYKGLIMVEPPESIANKGWLGLVFAGGGFGAG